MARTRLKFSYVDGAGSFDDGPVHQPICYVSSGDNSLRFQQFLADTINMIAPSSEQCEKALDEIEQFEHSNKFLLVLKGPDTEFVIDRSGVVQVIKLVAGSWVNKPDGRFLLHNVKKALEARQYFLGMPASLETSHEIEL